MGDILSNGRIKMTKFATKACAGICSMALILTAVPTYAKTPSSLSDLVGARGAGGEEQLESRGYYNTHVSTEDDRKVSYWWNSSKKECVRVTTYDGRYESINAAQSTDCGQAKSSSGDKTAATAVGAAALLGIAALASKSHHRDDRDYDMNGTAEFERGYRDGLYNQSYHNYNRSDAYSHGFEKGVRQRGYETSYRPGYGYGGGYGGYVNVNDLVGQSKGYANSSLSQRGFVMRDSDKTDYNGRYTTWWRAASEQCITVNTRDGYVYTVQTARKRNCR